jgi:hypothetical protein
MVLDKVHYRRRRNSGASVGLKKFRRFSTRYEKLAKVLQPLSNWLSAFATCASYRWTENQHFENTA